jgi:hypothetical protein
MIRYFLMCSVVLNSILLMSVLGIIPFLLYASTLVNMSLGWFVYSLLNRAEDVTEDQEELFSGFYDLADHLKSVHELEMFYGEPVLQDLIDHTKKVVQDIEDYKKVYDEDNEIEGLTNGEEDVGEEDAS